MRDLRAILEESSLELPWRASPTIRFWPEYTRLLGSGELLIAAGLPMHGGAATQAEVSSQPAAAPAPALASSSKGQPSDPVTFPHDLNGAAQAAALTQAAASGAAVCPT